MATAVAVRPKPRLAKPAYVPIDDSSWHILTDSVFPTATDPNVIALAWEVCRVRKLDIFRKPYNIVRAWSSAVGREVEQLWPSINELLVTASRTGEFAGVDEPIHGKEITETFHGRRRRYERGRETWVDSEVTVTYPETVSITVYRFVKGQKCSYVMPVRWKEEYARVGAGPLPNDMWVKRVYDQCQKVALAASLRVGFPDVIEPEADDLSVSQLPGEAPIIDNAPSTQPSLPEQTPPPKPAEPPMDPETGEVSPHTIAFVDGEERETWQQWGARFIAACESSTDEVELDKWLDANRATLDTFKTEADVMFSRVEARINKHRNKLKTAMTTKGDQADESGDRQ